MSKDRLFVEDQQAKSTMKPHRDMSKEQRKKKRRRKRQRMNHGLRNGELPEPEPKRYYSPRKDKFFEPALEVRGRSFYFPSLSDPDPFLIERLLGTPLVF